MLQFTLIAFRFWSLKFPSQIMSQAAIGMFIEKYFDENVRALWITRKNLRHLINLSETKWKFWKFHRLEKTPKRLKHVFADHFQEIYHPALVSSSRLCFTVVSFGLLCIPCDHRITRGLEKCHLRIYESLPFMALELFILIKKFPLFNFRLW